MTLPAPVLVVVAAEATGIVVVAVADVVVPRAVAVVAETAVLAVNPVP
jgi:hypothetical protein